MIRYGHPDTVSIASAASVINFLTSFRLDVSIVVAPPPATLAASQPVLLQAIIAQDDLNSLPDNIVPTFQWSSDPALPFDRCEFDRGVPLGRNCPLLGGNREEIDPETLVEYPAAQSLLVIRPETLTAGAAYTFTVTVTPRAVPVQSTEIAEGYMLSSYTTPPHVPVFPPTTGYCEFVPQEPLPLQFVTVECYDFRDVNTDGGIVTFQYFYSISADPSARKVCSATKNCFERCCSYDCL